VIEFVPTEPPTLRITHVSPIEDLSYFLNDEEIAQLYFELGCWLAASDPVALPTNDRKAPT